MFSRYRLGDAASPPDSSDEENNKNKNDKTVDATSKPFGAKAQRSKLFQWIQFSKTCLNESNFSYRYKFYYNWFNCCFLILCNLFKVKVLFDFYFLMNNSVIYLVIIVKLDSLSFSSIKKQELHLLIQEVTQMMNMTGEFQQRFGHLYNFFCSNQFNPENFFVWHSLVHLRSLKLFSTFI